MLLVAAKCLGGCMWALPVITFFWIMGSCFVTYTIAVVNNHTFPDFPYISYTAIEAPEQGIFTITIAIGAVFLAANAEMQYLFIKKLFIRYSPEDKWRNINRAALTVGMLSGLGLLFVACFQVDTMKPPHYAGAFMCFGSAMVYAWVQVCITWKIRHFDVITQESRRKGFMVAQICQIINSIMSTVLFITFAASKTLYNNGRDEGLGTKWDTLRSVFLVSTISEWLLTLSVTLFLLTFIPAFRMFSHTRIEIDFVSPHLANGDAPVENGNGQNEGMELMTRTESPTINT